MNNEIKNQIISLAIGVFAIIFVLFGYGVIKNIAQQPKQPDVLPEIDKSEIELIKNESSKVFEKFSELKQVSIYPNGLVTPRSLVEACKDGSKSPGLCSKEIATITKTVESSGGVQKVYLYIKAGVSRDGASMGPLTQFDSIWFYIDSSNYGGHLLRSSALVNQQTEDGVTELLFDLSSIPFVDLPYSRSKTPEVKDLLKILSESGEHFVGSFVSTLGDGKIFEILIGYEGGNIVLK